MRKGKEIEVGSRAGGLAETGKELGVSSKVQNIIEENEYGKVRRMKWLARLERMERVEDVRDVARKYVRVNKEREAQLK